MGELKGGILIVLLFLLSCSTVQTVSQSTFDEPSSSLAFEEQVYDFGIAGPEQKIRHTFKFTNSGSIPLKITKLSPSCGCTVALSSEDDVLPGGSGDISAVMETQKYEGKQEAAITVYSNDKLKPETVLTIKGRIKKGVAVVPQGINFGSVKNGDTARAHIRVLQLSEQTLILDKIDADDRYFTINSFRFNEENIRGIQIDVSMKPDMPPGVFSDVITLHTNVNKYPRIDVPVIANIVQN